MPPKATVKPDGEKIRKLRSPAFTGQELAEESGLSLRTITNLEAGESVAIDTIRRLAKALGVAVNELLAEPVERPRIRIKITTLLEFDGFGETEQAALRDMLTRNANPTGVIVITEIARGSTIVTIEIDEADAVALAEAFKKFRGESEERRESEERMRREGIVVYAGGKPITNDSSGFNKVTLSFFDVKSIQLPDSDALPDDLRGKMLS